MKRSDIQKLIKENNKLISDIVFLTKQVANRDKILLNLEKVGCFVGGCAHED